MAAKPRVSADVANWAASSEDGITILGMLPDLAAVATGNKLVKDVAGMALKLSERADIEVMGEEAVLLSSRPPEGTAPIAALMDVQQRADAGDRQAAREMAVIRSAAKTASGRQIAAPLLREADAKLAKGRALEAKKEPFIAKYTLMGACL